MEQEKNNVSIYIAPPIENRKTVDVRTKILKQAQIPEFILEDKFLNSLIGKSLPRNYNFEIHKTIWKIKQVCANKVLLQLPEGLIRFGPIIVDILSCYLNQTSEEPIRFITMGDLTYGACCIDDYLASSLGFDLIVHYAHSCLVPINQLEASVKYLYIFLDIKFDTGHLLSCVRHNFEPEAHVIALASTIQFVTSVHELAHKLKQLQFDVTLPQSRPLSPGEVLGCTAPRLNSSVNTIIFICDGRFHLEALMIANPGIKTYRYDPYSRKLTMETFDFDQMYQLRSFAIEQAAQTLERGGSIGFILGTLGRQGNESVYNRLVGKLNRFHKSEAIKLMLPEVTPMILSVLDCVDIWVQIACPRLSIDWGSFFNKPLLNPFEYIRSINLSSDATIRLEDHKTYPMDFYAKDSCGDHTPNHSCFSNQNCSCAT